MKWTFCIITRPWRCRGRVRSVSVGLAATKWPQASVINAVDNRRHVTIQVGTRVHGLREGPLIGYLSGTGPPDRDVQCSSATPIPGHSCRR
jgi:hypothetical protein